MVQKFSWFFFLSLWLVACGESKEYWQPLQSFVPLKEGKASFVIGEPEQEVQTLYVNIFAKDCVYCIQEMPDLNAFYEKYKTNPKVQLVGIGTTLDAIDADPPILATEARADVAEFANEHNIRFPVFLADSEQLPKISVTAFPETLVFQRDRTGKMFLKRKFISVVTMKDLEAYLR